jgi:hypothetical protein
MSFPQLVTIGGTFLIANNTELTTIDGFDKVSTVGGSIDWTGSFNNASLPSISDVRGGVNVQSSSDTFQCPFPQIRTNGVTKGRGFICSGNILNPSGGINGTNQPADYDKPSHPSTGSTSQLPSSSGGSSQTSPNGNATHSGIGMLKKS